ncbi:MAG: hypothetical protein ACRCU2_13540, partial [Planktothrix sp.]
DSYPTKATHPIGDSRDNCQTRHLFTELGPSCDRLPQPVRPNTYPIRSQMRSPLPNYQSRHLSDKSEPTARRRTNRPA